MTDETERILVGEAEVLPRPRVVVLEGWLNYDDADPESYPFLSLDYSSGRSSPPSVTGTRRNERVRVTIRLP